MFPTNNDVVKIAIQFKSIKIIFHKDIATMYNNEARFYSILFSKFIFRLI
jgi:hypothetical protein